MGYRLSQSQEMLKTPQWKQYSKEAAQPPQQFLMEEDDNPYAEKLRSIHRDILKKLGPTSTDRSRMGWQRTAKYASLGRLSHPSLNQSVGSQIDRKRQLQQAVLLKQSEVRDHYGSLRQAKNQSQISTPSLNLSSRSETYGSRLSNQPLQQ